MWVCMDIIFNWKEGVEMKIPIISNLLDKGSQETPINLMPSHNINFSGSPGADYPESYYRNQNEIRKVGSEEAMNEWVESSLLSRKCKDAFKSLIANLYDDNVILSYHALEIQSEIAFLKAKVFLAAPVKANSYKSDVYNPVWSLVMSEIFYQLELRFTRTVGEDRERIAQGKIEQNYNIRQGNLQQPQKMR